MSVIGFDFGSSGCYVAVARQGGIETIDNEYSHRRTPSYVSFGEAQRSMGTAALQAVTSNTNNTVCGFKHLLGRDFNDPSLAVNKRFIPAKLAAGSDGGINIQVQYCGEQQSFTAQQITAMLFTKLKSSAEVKLGIKVNDCVVSVPSYFTDVERRALQDAVSISGLNCLKVMNDTTATCLAYGLFKQDLPEPETKPRNVVFIDMGHTAVQTCVCAFNKGKLKVLATAFDKSVGGRDFDMLLTETMAADFKTRYKVDAMSAQKPLQRLLRESENLKKRMSANKQNIPVSIECFMNDKDVTYSMNRETFEGLAAPLFAKVEKVFQELLQTVGMKSEDIYAVEITGGSSRIPVVKDLVKKVFGHEPSTTLNADESVARGCAIQCAILSPTFRVRDFAVADCQPFPIKLTWDKNDEHEDNQLEIFSQFHAVPYSKMLSFYRQKPFTLRASYADAANLPHPKTDIGEFTVKNIVPDANGESAKVKVKLRLDSFGVFKVSNASMIVKLEDETPMETDAKQEGEAKAEEQGGEPEAEEGAKDPAGDDQQAPEDAPKDGPANGDVPMEEDKADKAKTPEKAKKKKVKSEDLPVEAHVPQMTADQIHRLVERENEMVMADKLEKERMDAKNYVEEYVYEMREKLADSLENFVDDKHRDQFRELLAGTEDWLYEDGEDCKKHVYVDKLKDLKKQGDPIVNRHGEAQVRPAALERLSHAIVHVRKVLEKFDQKDEAYDHISAEDMAKVRKCLEEKAAWHDRQLVALSKLSSWQDPPVLAAQLDMERTLLESTCNPIINKPKPKVEPPKEEAPAPEPAKEGEAAPSERKEETKPSPEMEVD